MLYHIIAPQPGRQHNHVYCDSIHDTACTCKQCLPDWLINTLSHKDRSREQLRLPAQVFLRNSISSTSQTGTECPNILILDNSSYLRGLNDSVFWGGYYPGCRVYRPTFRNACNSDIQGSVVNAIPRPFHFQEREPVLIVQEAEWVKKI